MFVAKALLAFALHLPAHLPDPSLFCLTSTVYGEARGESEIGQALVAQTILNRAADQRWPESVCGVVAQRSQYSGYGAATPRTAAEFQQWALAEAISQAVIDGNFRAGSCSQADHFHATNVSPSWARSMTRLCRVDNHIFYKGKQ